MYTYTYDRYWFHITIQGPVIPCLGFQFGELHLSFSAQGLKSQCLRVVPGGLAGRASRFRNPVFTDF